MRMFSLIVILLIKIVQNQLCADIPPNQIYDCNITCATCSGRDSCKSCQPFLNLVQTRCVAPTNDVITYNEYFYGQNLTYDRNLIKFQVASANLTVSDVQKFCIDNTYRFEMLGLFGSRNQLTFTQTYTSIVSEIAINFRIFNDLESSIIVKIQLNGDPAFNISLPKEHSLGFLYDDETQYYYLNNTDMISYTDKVFIPVRTGFMSLNDKTVTIKIIVQEQVLTPFSNTQFWGINQISVVAKKCKNCVSESLKTLTAYLAIIVGISAGIVVLLVFILHIYEKIKKDRLRKINRERYKNSI